MNEAQITYDFLTTKLPLKHLAKKHDTTTTVVVTAVLGFLKLHPKSTLKPKIMHKLKAVLTKDYISYNGPRDEFAAEYGMSERYFVELMKEVIDDVSIISSDCLADRLYIKLTSERTTKVSSVPQRIVRIIGEHYINPVTRFTQEVLANIYGIRDSSISAILRRGIAEKIYDDTLADKIYAKVRSCRCMTDDAEKLYIAAFEQREAV